MATSPALRGTTRNVLDVFGRCVVFCACAHLLTAVAAVWAVAAVQGPEPLVRGFRVGFRTYTALGVVVGMAAARLARTAGQALHALEVALIVGAADAISHAALAFAVFVAGFVALPARTTLVFLAMAASVVVGPMVTGFTTAAVRMGGLRPVAPAPPAVLQTQGHRRASAPDRHGLAGWVDVIAVCEVSLSGILVFPCPLGGALVASLFFPYLSPVAGLSTAMTGAGLVCLVGIGLAQRKSWGLYSSLAVIVGLLASVPLPVLWLLSEGRLMLAALGTGALPLLGSGCWHLCRPEVWELFGEDPSWLRPAPRTRG